MDALAPTQPMLVQEEIRAFRQPRWTDRRCAVRLRASAFHTVFCRKQLCSDLAQNYDADHALHTMGLRHLD